MKHDPTNDPAIASALDDLVLGIAADWLLDVLTAEDGDGDDVQADADIHPDGTVRLRMSDGHTEDITPEDLEYNDLLWPAHQILTQAATHHGAPLLGVRELLSQVCDAHRDVLNAPALLAAAAHRTIEDLEELMQLSIGDVAVTHVLDTLAADDITLVHFDTSHVERSIAADDLPRLPAARLVAHLLFHHGEDTHHYRLRDLAAGRYTHPQDISYAAPPAIRPATRYRIDVPSPAYLHAVEDVIATTWPGHNRTWTGPDNDTFLAPGGPEDCGDIDSAINQAVPYARIWLTDPDRAYLTINQLAEAAGEGARLTIERAGVDLPDQSHTITVLIEHDRDEPDQAGGVRTTFIDPPVDPDLIDDEGYDFGLWAEVVSCAGITGPVRLTLPASPHRTDTPPLTGRARRDAAALIRKHLHPEWTHQEAINAVDRPDDHFDVREILADFHDRTTRPGTITRLLDGAATSNGTTIRLFDPAGTIVTVDSTDWATATVADDRIRTVPTGLPASGADPARTIRTLTRLAARTRSGNTDH